MVPSSELLNLAAYKAQLLELARYCLYSYSRTYNNTVRSARNIVSELVKEMEGVFSSHQTQTCNKLM